MWIVFGVRSKKIFNINRKKFKIEKLTLNIFSQSSKSFMLTVLHQKFFLADIFTKNLRFQLNFESTKKAGTSLVEVTWSKKQLGPKLKPRYRPPAIGN